MWMKCELSSFNAILVRHILRKVSDRDFHVRMIRQCDMLSVVLGCAVGDL